MKAVIRGITTDAVLIAKCALVGFVLAIPMFVGLALSLWLGNDIPIILGTILSGIAVLVVLLSISGYGGGEQGK